MPDAPSTPELARLPDRVAHDGLVLRRWTVDDAEVLDEAVQANLEHLRPYLPWVAAEPIGVEGRRKLIATWTEGWERGDDAVYGAFELDGGRFVGGSGLHRRIGPGGLEIGYWVDRRSLGLGVARRMSEALTDVAFTLDDVDRVEIHHDLTNVWSKRVPEQLGFRLADRVTLSRDLAPAETGIELIWRTTRAEWSARVAPVDG